jgi:23S rRNA (uracil1939-C5)-methyltransferase
MDILCSHFDVCSGCTLNTAVDAPPILNEARRFFSDRGCSLCFHKDQANGWRLRAKLAIQGTAVAPRIGLYKEKTHDVIDIPSCKVHHPSINQAVELLRKKIPLIGLTPYNEKTQAGELRYAQFTVERSSGKVQMALVVNSNGLSESTARNSLAVLNALQKDDHFSFWHSLWLNFNPLQTNTIFGSQWHLSYGEPFIWEFFGRTQVCFLPSSFAQANLNLFEKMLDRLIELVPEGCDLAEFYAGTGCIGLFLAKKCRSVVCCEVNPYGEECFQHSKAKLPPEISKNIFYHVGKAGELTDLILNSDTIVVDPPRKGLDFLFLKALCEIKCSKRLIYVSCGWNAFKRDCDALLANGWSLETADSYLFFPGIDHLEILASFQFLPIPASSPN